MIEIRQLLKRLDITAIFVTHNKDEVFTFADKIAVMHQGQVLQVGAPALVCQQPNSWQVADFLQLGSWLPVTFSATENSSALSSLIGVLAPHHIKNITGSENSVVKNFQLLVKPSDIVLSQHKANNVIIEHIGVTEQGYHYLLSSLEKNTALAFSQLSFYSQELFMLGAELAIQLKGEHFLLYPTEAIIT